MLLERRAAVFDVLSTSTIGVRRPRSLLQKALRYGAKYTELPDGVHADTRIVVLVTIALLSIKSVFVPDLGTHVRGCTNAAKRLAVIMVEDAWPRMGLLRGLGAVHGQSFNPGTVLSALLGAPWSRRAWPTYEPDDSVLFASLLVGVACHQSDQILDWRGHSEASELSTRSDLDGMQMAARLLRIVRSFEGDMNMMDSAAKMTRGDGTIRVMASGTEPVGIMPLCHMIDQHVYRGMGFTTADGDRCFKSGLRPCSKRARGGTQGCKAARCSTKGRRNDRPPAAAHDRDGAFGTARGLHDGQPDQDAFSALGPRHPRRRR